MNINIFKIIINFTTWERTMKILSPFSEQKPKEHFFNCSLLKKGHYINTLTR